MYLQPNKGIEKHGRDLPHWQQVDGMQFVTFRLGDAMPETKLARWREERDCWLRQHPQPRSDVDRREYHRLFTYRLERWLDKGHGSCLLRSRVNREPLENALMRFQDERVIQHSWVIMPNHVHLLFTPLVAIEDLIKAWKGVSSRAIGRGSIWQKNYRDTMIRNPLHLWRVVRYIRRNPRRLPADAFTLWESPLARKIK